MCLFCRFFDDFSFFIFYFIEKCESREIRVGSLSSIEGRFSPSCLFKSSLVKIIPISPTAKQPAITILAYISGLVKFQISL